jgi:hypothetical protein
MLKTNQRGFAHMTLLLVFVVLFGIVGAYIYVSSRAAPKTPTTSPTSGTTGNGAPNGAHYNLNVIGVPKDKTADITSGHRIFVPLEGVCKINLSPGEFGVTDGNCTEGPAAFSLPVPDGDADGNQDYTVWARPLGKPGGKATATTCATDPTTGEEVCSLESTAFVRSKGKSTFSDVSKGFLTVLYDDDADATTDPIRISIFDELLQDYLWNYDNNGLKNLQLRFYQK